MELSQFSTIYIHKKRYHQFLSLKVEYLFFFNDEQPSKVEYLIDDIEEERETEANERHPLKAEYPISSTDDGIIIYFKEEHSKTIRPN